MLLLLNKQFINRITKIMIYNDLCFFFGNILNWEKDNYKREIKMKTLTWRWM